MKKLLILLLLPLFSFSQTFDELMTINSEDTFKKVVIENDYEFYQEEDGVIVYGWKLDGDNAQMWGNYNKNKNDVIFQFSQNWIYGHRDEFKEITSEIKSRCEYYRINEKWAAYKCPESSNEFGFQTADDAGYVYIKLVRE